MQLEILLIDFKELVALEFITTEYLYDSIGIDHFLRYLGNITHGALDILAETAKLTRYTHHDQEHDRSGNQENSRQLPVQPEHVGEQDNNAQGILDERRQRR